MSSQEGQRGDELLRAAQDGDRGAFGLLISLHKERAHRLALGWVGSHEQARDLAQDAFVRAYQALDRVDPSRPFLPWLYQILRRLCMNHLRDERRRGEKLRLGAALVARERSEDPAFEAERAELRERCREAIADLPDDQREALVLREYHGLKYREVADLLEVPLGTVMSRLYSARRRLAASLEETQ